jgi:quinol-cytochrome oxidoreductase complex cytochrome b subunit
MTKNQRSRMHTPRNMFTRIKRWFDSRIGLSNTFLRPVPRYSLELSYWIGAITVVIFFAQGASGVMMLPYYIPTPENAYSSTLSIIQMIPFGNLIESFHLYGAYAMVLLAFIHMMRGYFVVVYKKPRELMWIVGMLMGLVTILFGFTGYLLPWTVLSKSATDVSIGIMNNLPDPFRGFMIYLVQGFGGDVALLNRFYGIHVVILPILLILLLAIKLHMFEIHSAHRPKGQQDYLNPGAVVKQIQSQGKRSPASEAQSLVPWFPTIAAYMLMISAVTIAILLVVSALFPLVLEPEFTPEAATEHTPVPEFYFMWTYQIFKISIFEGEGIVGAIGLVTLLAIVFILLPFIDRGKEEAGFRNRPVFTSLGILAIVEILILVYWGYATPGQVVASEQALIFLGVPAAIILGIGYLYARRHRNRISVKSGGSTGGTRKAFEYVPVVVFMLLLAIASVALRFSLEGFPGAYVNPLSLSAELPFVIPAFVLLFTFISMANIQITQSRKDMTRRIQG